MKEKEIIFVQIRYTPYDFGAYFEEHILNLLFLDEAIFENMNSWINFSKSFANRVNISRFSFEETLAYLPTIEASKGEFIFIFANEPNIIKATIVANNITEKDIIKVGFFHSEQRKPLYFFQQNLLEQFFDSYSILQEKLTKISKQYSTFLYSFTNHPDYDLGNSILFDYIDELNFFRDSFDFANKASSKRFYLFSLEGITNAKQLKRELLKKLDYHNIELKEIAYILWITRGYSNFLSISMVEENTLLPLETYLERYNKELWARTSYLSYKNYLSNSYDMDIIFRLK